MTDNSVNMQRPRSRKASSAEYRVYFAMIVVAALPVTVLAWGFTALRHGKMPAQDPITRALHEAGEITPMIVLV